ncbi:MAG: hypothetical protein KQH53_15245 [Desulfarculaceae bacterium]|nr:hypothetical protein [Desulfarculaceae bacterium]
MFETQNISGWLLLAISIAGGVVTGATMIITSYLTKKSEENKSLQALVFNAAIENWKLTYEYVRSNVPNGKTIIFPPLETFLVHMWKAQEIMFDKGTTSENVESRLRELSQFSKSAMGAYQDSEKSTPDEAMPQPAE